GPPTEQTATGESAQLRAVRTRLGFLRQRWKSSLLILGVLVALVLLIVQRRSQDAANVARRAAEQALDENQKLNRPIDPFTFGPFTLRPSETDRVESGIKPGHWTTATLEVRANFDDFRGDLAAEMVTPTGDGVELDGQRFRLRSLRPAVLAKMQKKLLDVPLLTPVHSPHRQVASRLLSPSGRDMWNARELLTIVPAEQFFFTVLAQEVDDYRFLHTMDSIWAPRGSAEDRGAQAHYRVLLPRVTTAAPLAEQALFWTNTAVVLWDGFDPRLLTGPQQQAMLDWLHWGGQLIVSGPGSLESLRDNFLDSFLPASAGDSWELDTDRLAPLARVSPDASRALDPLQPWTGQQLKTAGRDANVLVETEMHEPLIVERAVGRGRIVVTAFRLSQRGLVDWANYDALFNAVLLRHPARRFVTSYEGHPGVAWADGVLDDSARISRLRIFSRDAGRSVVAPPGEENLPWKQGLQGRRYPTAPDASLMHMQGELPREVAGVSSWDDESQVSQAVRAALREASRISVPQARFVLYMLGAYVLVLVPLNWFLCRALGRVELAWIAAPLIAVVFGILVVRFAQLNIGFDSAATEISVVELQADYPRAHVTRYALLYTSLSTDYSFELTNPSAVALPFAYGAGPLARQNPATVTLHQEPVTGVSERAPLSLTGLAVSSNATGMVHSEEMYPLAGGLSVRRAADGNSYRIRNRTGLNLRRAILVQGEGEAVSLGGLGPGVEAEFTLQSMKALPVSTERARNAASQDNDALSLSELVDLAQRTNEPGELRLIAWTDDELPGLTIKPTPTQSRRAAVVVAHLSYGPAKPIEIDFNSRAQIAGDPESEEKAIDSSAPRADNDADPPAENRP
ncbi:MAG: hypothetical protein ABUL64_01280, partial [Singulisphaera sp.]